MISAVILGLAAPPALMVPGPAYAQDGVDAGAVQRLVDGFTAKAGYPGVAVAITKGDRVLHVAGYGHDSAGAAVTATTPMPIASLSKSFTALAVMQLVEAGKVTLDAPVHDYLPDFQVADPRGERITVRQLLNQTSGITDRTLREKSLPQPDSLTAAVVRARAATLASEPGTRHAYTNTNYHLAARLVEVVAGEPFAGYLRRHVFEPLGMPNSTTIDLTPRDLPHEVRQGHVYAYGASMTAAEPKRFVNGSDGVITTASDLARWLVVQDNAGLATDGTRLVSAQSMTAMHTSSDRQWTYGMGWDTDSQGRVHHNGIWFTYTASALLMPSGYGIAVLGNSGFSLANGGTDQLADELATLVQGGGSAAPPAPTRLIADLVLAALTVMSLLLGVRRLRRTPAWAVRAGERPLWQPVLRLLPRLVPLAVLVTLPYLLGTIVGGGRDITFRQVAYTAPTLVVWSAVAAAMNTGSLVARVVALMRRRPARQPAR
ncbi:serine hydrolase [Dactylosporangium matsuzakiense]|uniref:Serine hydrolase n=1 Tax=Dactylosporangium matsuzakiense TaxID=53360 RepID=A0A9W6KXB1_9ACTN|nr:serine hydrolase [Dactylosporangium matsuzakiense]